MVGLLSLVFLSWVSSGCGGEDVVEDESEAREAEGLGETCGMGQLWQQNIYDGVFDEPQYVAIDSATFKLEPGKTLRHTTFAHGGRNYWPQDPDGGKLLLTVSNGGGGFLLVDPASWRYCTGDYGFRKPRITFFSSVKLMISPEGWTPGAQNSPPITTLCKTGTFQEKDMRCTLKAGVEVELTWYKRSACTNPRVRTDEGTYENRTGCVGDLTCGEDSRWEEKSCAARASSSRSYCSRRGFCESTMNMIEEGKPCANSTSASVFRNTAGEELGWDVRGSSMTKAFFWCRDGFWTGARVKEGEYCFPPDGGPAMEENSVRCEYLEDYSQLTCGTSGRWVKKECGAYEPPSDVAPYYNECGFHGYCYCVGNGCMMWAEEQEK